MDHEVASDNLVRDLLCQRPVRHQNSWLRAGRLCIHVSATTPDSPGWKHVTRETGPGDEARSSEVAFSTTYFQIQPDWPWITLTPARGCVGPRISRLVAM
ncbi:hypothetical protein CDD83_2786 [Cordyceps sp. RAO-2017]|nr:hypothetical protein CDD83_2786 [Cordyceps sp. RAO-2017]